MRVLSLFDGMSCGLEALKRNGVNVDRYYASEIDHSAEKISYKNHPEILRLGDVTGWDFWNIDFSKIDLLVGGSPCQGFSFAGKQLNFEDPRSKLFFSYVDILKYIKSKNPKIKFLLENVAMKKEFLDVISDRLEVNPVMINSALYSAQNRKRFYWCNWDIGPVEDKGIMLRDIVHETTGDQVDLEPYKVPIDKSFAILDKEVERGKIGYFRQDSQANRVYSINGKLVTLMGDAGGGAAKMGQYLFGHIRTSYGTRRGVISNEKAPSLTSSSFEHNNHLLFGCLTPDRVEKRQNGRRFNDGDKSFTLTAQDKHGVLIDGYIRKLTPIECERLQTLPDNYTEGVSSTQRYKMLGNGWTVDVISKILKDGGFYG